MTVAIVQYNAGNIFSVSMALERIQAPYVVTDDPKILQSASRVIFPGVGEAGSAMTYLRSRGLDSVIATLQQPVLGICLGFQLLCEYSAESATPCLGIFNTETRAFTPPQTFTGKIPHMGWSTITCSSHPIFRGIDSTPYVYFVHSYRVDCSPHTIATCTYGELFAAAAACNNFVGVQFHPEKSGEIGEQIMRNFVEWQI